MAILDKVNQQKGTDSNSNNKLLEQDLIFILEKLKLATYIGHEFESFYNVWVKLSNQLDSYKK